MVVDGSVSGVSELPIICSGDTIEELAWEFDKKSQYSFRENKLHNGAIYKPCDIALIFDMEKEGKPLFIEEALQFSEYN
jgi:hypothetical protein